MKKMEEILQPQLKVGDTPVSAIVKMPVSKIAELSEKSTLSFSIEEKIQELSIASPTVNLPVNAVVKLPYPSSGTFIASAIITLPIKSVPLNNAFQISIASSQVTLPTKANLPVSGTVDLPITSVMSPAISLLSEKQDQTLYSTSELFGKR